MKPIAVALLICSVPVTAAAQTRRPPTDPLHSLPQDTVVAIMGDEVVRLRDLEAYSETKDRKRLFQLNQQVFDFREHMLSLMLGERLLKAEADKAGVPVDAFLDRHLKIEAVTDREIQDVLSRQPPSNIDPAVVVPLVRQYLEGRKREDARARYIADLVARAKRGQKPLVIHLRPPREEIAVDPSDPVRGAGDVELVEFSDFECPYCQRFQPLIKELLARFDGRVRHVWKDYPLPIHRSAVSAAAAARCAHEQGRFWGYHDVLFANQERLSPADLQVHARTAGLDGDAFDACLGSGRHVESVNGALKAASGYVVPATPTVFINGRMVQGVAPVERYAAIIAEEIGESPQ